MPKRVELTDADIARALAVQGNTLVAGGFTEHPLSDAQTRHYGVHGAVANSSVFTRGLDWRHG